MEEWTKKHTPHLVIVEIKEKKKHPSADRLSLCQVESQKGKLHSIVCGADNFQEGDKAVLALPGAVLPGPFEIKTREIRGEKSEGMLASLSELGLADSADSADSEGKEAGILILPQSAPTGADFADYARLNDIIFDIDITPNRADCLSHLGLARELSGILNRRLSSETPKSLERSRRKAVGKKDHSRKKNLELKVQQKDLCLRYTERLFIK